LKDDGSSFGVFWGASKILRNLMEGGGIAINDPACAESNSCSLYFLEGYPDEKTNSSIARHDAQKNVEGVPSDM